MRVRDLGALLVEVDARERPVAGTRAPAILAMLVIHANERVSVDALREAAWGDQVGERVESTLESHIWRLRQVLEPERTRWQPPTVLVNDAGGFRLAGGPSTIDSLAFAEAAREVRHSLAAGDPETAIRRAEAALGSWRGQPYGAFADADWARAAVARLEEIRTQLQEKRIEALLAIGATDVALSDLTTLIAGMPFHEPLRALQMEALFRGGRTEQALQAYQQARRTLVDEVGIEPSTQLQELHRRILDNDASLSRPSVAPRPDHRRAVEVRLPPSLTPLVGRGEVVARLAELVRRQRLVTITGAAGCGKTRLSVEVARSVAAEFPDGVWFVDLTAVSDLDLVADVIISTIGFLPAAGATPGEDLRGYLAARRVLLVLDNCEHVLPAVAEIAELCLGGTPAELSCCFLATSREPLAVPGEVTWVLGPLALPESDPVPGAQPLDPTPSAAVELFLQRLQAVRPALLVDDRVLQRATEICIAVDGLPLPLELAAARTVSYSLEDVAQQVSADPSRLGRLGRGGRDHRATVRSAIEWSHRLLDPAQQAAHRRLAVLPGPFTSDVAVAVIGDPGGRRGAVGTLEASAPDGSAEDVLAQLVHCSMLASDGARDPGRPTTFRQLATIRGHAQHALAQAHEVVSSSDARDGWTGRLLAARPPLGTAGEADWHRVIDDNYATVRATLARHLIEEPDSTGGRLATRLSYYWYYRGKLIESGRWLQLACDVLRDGDPVDLLLAEITLASALAVQYRIDLARPYLDDAFGQLDAVPSERLLEVGEALVGLAAAAWIPEAHDVLIAGHRALQRIVERVPSPNLVLLTDALEANALFVTGRVDAAIEHGMALYRRATAADHPMATWLAASPMMVAALLDGEPVLGIPWVERILQQHYRLGTGACGMFLENRGSFSAMAGDFERAVEFYAAARTLTRRSAMVWPRRPMTSQFIDEARTSLGPETFSRGWQYGERLTLADVVDRFRDRPQRVS